PATGDYGHDVQDRAVSHLDARLWTKGRPRSDTARRGAGQSAARTVGAGDPGSVRSAAARRRLALEYSTALRGRLDARRGSRPVPLRYVRHSKASLVAKFRGARGTRETIAIMSDTSPCTTAVWQALAAIPDPEFGVSIVDLALIYSVERLADDVNVVMTL